MHHITATFLVLFLALASIASAARLPTLTASLSARQLAVTAQNSTTTDPPLRSPSVMQSIQHRPYILKEPNNHVTKRQLAVDSATDGQTATGSADSNIIARNAAPSDKPIMGHHQPS
ncbi:uncharacterized protein FOMMEDRAFT_149952 [Fomitiporia mediterranea MF3/22]|uniref:uncharacterized protein n=1 Tax=Fomitiporia mediterranea (strain MF3/22) TaxID=694068 RepID=UPI0004407576|nr:uncharacterized protein FOMMEDRAFT_149952 [Fomitiporia mediterranea MF3/22]EJD07427.1 hypothetical protein FOMMEDRAFT_149952 [Fomitiporia mediterranea MF3/22]